MIQGEYKGHKEQFLIFDLETTGLDPKANQITEVAAILTDLEREIGRIEFRVRLQRDPVLSDKIKEITGITEEDLKGALTEEQAVLMLYTFAGDATWVGQYIPFDLSYLAQFGVEPDHFIDVSTITKLLEPNESASLGPTYKRVFGKEPEGHHRAMNDVEMTLELFREQIKRAEQAGITRRDIANVVIKRADRDMAFVPKLARVVNEADIAK